MAPAIENLFNRLHAESRRKSMGRETRVFALKQLRKLIDEAEPEILKTLAEDLGKPHFEAYTSEVFFVQKEISYALNRLKGWMKPKRVSAGLLNQPARARIHSKPKGVVLIISPWNYPFQLLFAPLVGALAAGNRVILKPSEVASATSTLVAKLIPRYFPDDLVSVVEGAVKETSELLALPFDHIFYTGSTPVGKKIL